MAQKRRKGRKTTRVSRPRDPAWRFRHALGHKVAENPKAYRKTAERRAARNVEAESDDD